MGVSAGIAAVVVSGVSAYEANRTQKAAAKKEEEARDIAAAEQTSQQRAQTRQQIREERIRRAQILQSSENTGVSGSSGALGATSALQTSLGSNLASASRQANAARAITGVQQEAADLRISAAETLQTGKLLSSAISTGGGMFDAYQSATKTTNVAEPTKVGGFSPATEKNPYNLFG